MRKKILVLGYFGYANNQLDGQTVKTRNVYQLVKIYDQNSKVYIFDTQLLKTNKLHILKMLWLVIRSNTVLYLPAHNNLKQFFPILYRLSKFSHFNIIYLVVGGWLANFLKKNSSLVDGLSNITQILCENMELKSNLENEFGFNNVGLIPNFRIENVSNVQTRTNNDFKLVFMSRIDPIKGLDTMFYIADKLDDVKIDFYGQVAEQAINFYHQIESHENTKYLGVLQPKDINKTLINYDALVLPTKYAGEGFSGAVIDAYMAGVPVIISDWLYAKELVDEGQSGYICSVDNENEFVEAITILRDNADLLKKLKIGAKNKGKQYSPEKAWGILSKFI